MKNYSLRGNIGADPKFFEGKGDNQDRVHFSVAADKPRDPETGKARDDVETEWYDIVAFGALARNIHASLGKGDHVFVEGRLGIRKRNFYVENRDEELEEKAIPTITLRASTVGPTLIWQTADVSKAEKSTSRSGDGDDSGEAKPKVRSKPKAAAKPKASAAASVADDEF